MHKPCKTQQKTRLLVFSSELLLQNCYTLLHFVTGSAAAQKSDIFCKESLKKHWKSNHRPGKARDFQTFLDFCKKYVVCKLEKSRSIKCEFDWGLNSTSTNMLYIAQRESQKQYGLRYRCRHPCAFTHTYTHSLICSCKMKLANAYGYKQIHVPIQVHTHAYIYIYVYIYVYMYV